MNIAPNRHGLLNASVVDVMRETGRAINDTFILNNKGLVSHSSNPCGDGVVVLKVDDPTHEGFDYIITMEDMTKGQRVGNYSIDYRLTDSEVWSVLVPPVQPIPPTPPSLGRSGFTDRPDGNDPRDQYIGYKRIDTPVVNTRGLDIAEVRLNCVRLVENMEDQGDREVFIKQFSLHKKKVPWE